jgi:hypothetical protein
VSHEDGIDTIEAELFGQRAKDFFEFKIYGAQNQHIVTLRLRKREVMTLGDTTQMQNFLWTQVGYAIRENEELRRTLSLGGVEVLLDDPNPPEAAPDAN